MNTKIKYLIVKFSDLSLTPSEIPKLRGFFARKFPEDHLFHNHLPGGAQSYAFPRIQYRLIDSLPALLGVLEGIDLLKKVFFEIDEIRIGGESIKINERQISLVESDFGQTQELHHYWFTSPWMALNQENDRKYFKLSQISRHEMLLNILKGNLVSLSKGLGYTIPDRDQIQAKGNFREITVLFHNIPMHCFYGEFSISFKIPDLFGLGKQSARGFGVVTQRRIDDSNI